MTTRRFTLAFLLCALTCAATSAGAQTEPAKPPCATPQLAKVADSVAAAFDDHQFVMIGSTHGGKKPHDFLLCLISRPAFQRHTPDVLVEWATAAHQGLADGYLLKLEPMPIEALVPVWFDTEEPDLWARMPQMPEFYAAVRGINAKLDPAKRIRVLGGCAPVDWRNVRTAEDLAVYPFKTNWVEHILLQHYAPMPQQRLLMVYGEAHIYHQGRSFVSGVSAELGRPRIFVVGTIDDLSGGDGDAIRRLGDPAQPFFVPASRFPAAPPLPRALFYVSDGPLSDYIDAVVYLGPDADRNLSGSIAFTDAQRAELARRAALKGDPRQMMQSRYSKRSAWFKNHPNEIPPRP